MNILKQEYIITSPFSEKLALEGLRAQLASVIFDELIQREKSGIKLTFFIEVMDTATRPPDAAAEVV